MNRIISTENVSSDARLEYWRSIVQEHFIHFEMSSDSEDEGFDGTIITRDHGGVRFSQVLAGRHVARHSVHGKIHSDEDMYLLLVQRQGLTMLEQAEHRVVMHPGTLVLCDGSRSYSMTIPEYVHHDVLVIPGEVLRSSLRSPERYTALGIPTARGAGRLLMAFLSTLRHSVKELQPSSEGAVANASVELLCAALAVTPITEEPPSSSLQRYHLDRLRTFVKTNLADPELNVEHIAAALQLSKRHLHSLFEDQPTTLSAWIWKQRLDAARRVLANPSCARVPITQIAFSHGFKSSAHFSRAFQTAYKMSPRDFRAMTLGECSDET
ncbi:TPA: helix-turn-helix domain-containing protein [Pseudomonas aeruginosa]|nr:helix-turn-helix domain-containing protein [Pseudomonas aeruginosa]HCU2034445.1 helix-turn-helix domain-containing protein [Pseudomonas aeruginosa]